jgi:hypothetical protein
MTDEGKVKRLKDLIITDSLPDPYREALEELDDKQVDALIKLHEQLGEAARKPGAPPLNQCFVPL